MEVTGSTFFHPYIKVKRSGHPAKIYDKALKMLLKIIITVKFVYTNKISLSLSQDRRTFEVMYFES